MSDSVDDSTTDGPFDGVASALQRLRLEAGSPSYAAIALTIGRMREDRGQAGARPGRTTVYDAFRTGRRRLDVALVLDIVRALGADDDEVARWSAACHVARQAAEAGPGRVEPAPEAAGSATRTRAWRTGAILVIACVAVNLLGRALVDTLHLPLYLDMVGTATSAVVLGPWWGALVGVATNLGGVAISGPASIPFVLVNVTGALIWGYGVRRFALARSTPRFLGLNVVVAGACTMVAAPIIVLVFHGSVHHDADSIAAVMAVTGHSVVVAVFSANLLTSLADKLICGFVALAVAEGMAADGVSSGRDTDIRSRARGGTRTDFAISPRSLLGAR